MSKMKTETNKAAIEELNLVDNVLENVWIHIEHPARIRVFYMNAALLSSAGTRTHLEEQFDLPLEDIEYLDESEEQAVDAVAFAEWCDDSGYIRIKSGKNKGLWFHTNDTEFNHLTTSDLYKIFKTQTQ